MLHTTVLLSMFPCDSFFLTETCHPPGQGTDFLYQQSHSPTASSHTESVSAQHIWCVIAMAGRVLFFFFSSLHSDGVFLHFIVWIDFTHVRLCKNSALIFF